MKQGTKVRLTEPHEAKLTHTARIRLPIGTFGVVLYDADDPEDPDPYPLTPGMHSVRTEAFAWVGFPILPVGIDAVEIQVWVPQTILQVEEE